MAEQQRLLGGRYLLKEKVGTGGMATVFRAQDQVLNRAVAVKIMLPQYAGDPTFAARFKQEAQAAAALQSPYIVGVYDWGKDGDTYYIVMELLHGTDLKSGVRSHGALDPKKVAQIGSQICAALSVAHKHEIVHRDIKPQNIMVQPDGNIKVMDFGIARAKNSHLTQDNSVLGTAHYVSPEQTQGKELGPTTDIYSLGIVMYEAATGQVPFQGDDAISVALKQVNEQPKPPSQLNPAVDPSLESIILKCMQKNPADRFQTALELYHVLRDYLAGRMAQVNSATAVLPGSAAAVAATSKLEPGQGMAPGNTASMPRVSRTGHRPQRATEEAAEQEEKRDRKRKRNIVIGAVCGVIAAVAIIFALVNVLGNASKTYPVPDLAGMTADEAQTAITQDGHFKMGETKESYSSSVEQGKVMDQDPRASRQMPEGTTINIVISKGEEPKEQVSVPDLTNMTPKEAQEACTKVGLTAVAGDEVEDDNIEEGRIAKQDVEASSSAEKGTKVTYHVSKGTSEVVIPNVVGDSEDSATTTLKNAGFEVSVQYSESSDSVGKVISTSPKNGNSATKGSTVTITVGKAPSKVSVPSVIGMTYSDAADKLKANGFYAGLASGSSSSGIVTAQSETTATKGDTIYLTTKVESSSNGGSGSSNGGNETNGSSTGGTGSSTQQ